MIQRGKIIWVAAIALVGTALFQTSQKVQNAQMKLIQTHAQLEREQESLRVLKAEWSYLNNPEKIEQLAEKYLNVEPASGLYLNAVEELPAPVIEEITDAESLSLQPISFPLPRSKPYISRKPMTETAEPAPRRIPMKAKAEPKPQAEETSPSRDFNSMMRDLGVE